MPFEASALGANARFFAQKTLWSLTPSAPTKSETSGEGGGYEEFGFKPVDLKMVEVK